ncbi:cytosolic leucyl tRNA synthetase [Cerrena zonata]|uniref:leucine--tRNA ligase n=1 Tax=Cerrena zonata TaxID=2478898 RepID=A0AAW0FSZ2_9APHY
METILANKGTGVVTCVPSDSPDDYITTKDLANKPEYYKIEKDWVQTDIISIIKTEKYGDKCAEHLVKELKIQSPKDSVQLAAAKEAAYKEGFYNGVMAYGKYSGEKVEVAKAKCKNDLIESGEAFVYNEPEGQVISRSGDECIVSLEDQWYIDYGEDAWKSQAFECLELMQTFSKETRNGFEGVLDWLKNWAVTRNFGLGTRLPWDEKYLVESLSDSTIYMAYYTISRFLHSDYYGKEKGVFDIKPEQMTYDVFDYIFTRRENIETDIPLEQLKALRREFEYFYPLDARVSGKDLIPNHLTFFIYSHVALFPKQFWPRGVRANGHLLLNNAKMSKSTGNFLTLEQIVKKFGADASRIALADAGDTIEDANFDEANANAAILRLTTLKEWCEEQVKNQDSLREGEYASFFDEAFENEMNDLIEKTYEQYRLTNYKSALKSGLFDFQTSRDYYRDSLASTIAPIASHFAEYLYRDVLGKKDSVQNARFPSASKPVSQSLIDSLDYVRQLARAIRETEINALKAKKGKADITSDKPTKLTILVSTSFPEWQDNYIDIVRDLFEKQSLNDNKLIKEKVGKDMKRAMPFISLLKARLTKEDPAVVFNRKLTFDEVSVVKSVLKNIEKSSTTVEFKEIEIIAFPHGATTGKNILTGDDVEITIKGKVIDNAIPGEPVLKGHEGGVWALKYTGNTLVSGSTDRSVRVWNIKTGKCTHVFRGHTSTVRCLDILHPVKIGKNDKGEDIIFPEVPLLVTGSRDHNLHVWKLPLDNENDPDLYKLQQVYDSTETTNNPYLVAVLTGHSQSVRSVTGYGNIIVSGSYDTTVRVWDLLEENKCKFILEGHSDRIYSTALNFQTKRCYSGSMDSSINVWDIEKGELLYSLEGHSSLVGLLELSEDYLVSAAADSTLRVWDPQSPENFSKLKGHSNAITCFQHDSLRVVSGSERMLKLWNIETGQFVRDLLADITGGIWQVRFDVNRCVAAVQRTRGEAEETFIEILDFSVPPSRESSKDGRKIDVIELLPYDGDSMEEEGQTTPIQSTVNADESANMDESIDHISS